MTDPPVKVKRGGHFRTTPKFTLTHFPESFDVVDNTPLVCSAQPWSGREHGNTQVELLDEPKPPHSLEAEQGVLGSMLQRHDGAEAIAEAMAKIGPEYFYVPAHRTIFTAICDQWDAGQAIDLITFTQSLRDKNLLDAVGGAAFVTNLFTFVPTAANVQFYLEIVREKYARREGIAACAEATRRLYDEQDDDLSSLDALTSKADSIRSLLGRNGALPPMEDGAELVAQPIVLPPDVIEGVLHRGAKMVLGGSSKSFKTWALVDCAISVATGTAWLGKFLTKRGRVLYINLELQGAVFSKRLFDVCDENQVTLESGYLTVWNLRGRACDLSELLPLLLREIGRDKYVLIIIDPIYKLLGKKRDENKAGDIATLLNEIEKLAVETGAAVAFGAHYSKGNQAGKEVIDRIGGSGVFARDPDSLLNFTKHEEEFCFTVDATLRNHPPITPFVARWEYPVFVADNTLNPGRLKQAGGATKKFTVEDFVDLVKAPRGKSEIIATAERKLKCSRRTAYDLFNEAIAAGLLIEREDGEYERPSPNGAEVAEIS